MDPPPQVPPPTEILFLPNQSYLGWKIVITVFHSLAISSTIYRLVHRRRICRLWKDDYILLGAFILDFVHWPLFWARSPSVEGSSRTFFRIQQILNSYWLTVVPLFLVMCLTRISVALSFARIFPPRHPARRWSFTLVWFLMFNFIGTILATSLTCKSGSELLVAAEMRNCIRFPNNVPLKNIITFTSDAISDISLILTPLYFFWRVKLPAQERRLVLIFFCGSTLTLSSAISYAAIANSHSVIGKKDWPLVNLGLGGIECSMSFIACNSVVISTCFYQAILRVRGRERPDIESTIETPRVPPSRECTCIISEQLTAISLTDISGHSYNFESDSRGALDTFSGSSRHQHSSVASSQNQTSSFSSSEKSSNYTTSQDSDSRYTSSQHTQESEISESSHSRSTSSPGSHRSQSTGSEFSSQRSLSTVASQTFASSNRSSQL